MRVEIAGEPRQPGQVSEEFAAATPEALVLVDGAGSPAGLESGCRHGTAWYVRRLGVHLLARLTDRADRTAAQCLSDAIAETAALHGARCDLSHPNTPAAAVVAARRRGAALEYAVLGDSLLVLHPQAGETLVVSDDRPFPAGEELRQRMWAAPVGSPERAALHMRYALAVRAARNTGRGPWVAAALPRAAEHAESGAVPLGGLRAVAALSDGAGRYVRRYGLGSWAEAMALMADSGPGELLARLRAVEASDPRCVRWPRGRAQDDATAVYARLG